MVHQAQRRDGAAVTIASASHSTLDVVTRALPLSGERVAIWSGIGERVAILGPDLQRLDAPGPVARLVRPWNHFRASSKSTFDLLCFYTLLLAAPAWLLVRLLLGRRATGGVFIKAAGLFLVLGLVGVWGYVPVLAWL